MVLLESNVGVRANGLEQLIRETFRVRACERVDPGSLKTVEILCRKVAWNVEDFFWIYDPIHALALADEFGLVGMRHLEQTQSILVTPGSKTMNKGLHDGADVLDDRETQQCRSLIGTALIDEQDRPETQCTTEESARFMSDPTRAVKCIFKRLRKHYSKASVHSWSFPYQEMQREVRVVTGHVGKGNWRDCQRRALGFVLVAICWRRILRHIRLWRCLLQRIEYISTKDVAHALQIRSDLAECDMTLRMNGKTDVTAGRCHTSARRGVGCLHHLDAR